MYLEVALGEAEGVEDAAGVPELRVGHLVALEDRILHRTNWISQLPTLEWLCSYSVHDSDCMAPYLSAPCWPPFYTRHCCPSTGQMTLEALKCAHTDFLSARLLDLSMTRLQVCCSEPATAIACEMRSKDTYAVAPSEHNLGAVIYCLRLTLHW